MYYSTVVINNAKNIEKHIYVVQQSQNSLSNNEVIMFSSFNDSDLAYNTLPTLVKANADSFISILTTNIKSHTT